MFELQWTRVSEKEYQRLKAEADQAKRSRPERSKTTKAEGLFKQVCKTLQHLRSDPRHPGLQTHEYRSLSHPYGAKQKVFEAYAQNRTSSAYRVFWCYGPGKNEMTILAITHHP